MRVLTDTASAISLSPPMTARLSLEKITKRFGETVANDAITLDVMPGEIVAVLGENGAGKSTLMKIVYGVVRPDAGRIVLDGREVEIESPARARALGISMVFQHFALFESLTLAENVALGLPPESLGRLTCAANCAAWREGRRLLRR